MKPLAFRQFEFDRVFVTRVDLVDRLEEDAARDGDALRRLGDPVEGGLDVVRRQLGAIMEQHPLAQEEGVGLAVLRDLPAVRQIALRFGAGNRS